jgi:hypothetical protein
MPSWSGLIHFDQVVSLNFTDAKKLDHLVKVIILSRCRQYYNN